MTISIIVPAYNVQCFLPRCLNSLLTQTYDDLEIIIVDDGSTDNTVQISDDYAHKHNNIRVIHKVNAGLPQARKTGVETSCGDYIGFVDADDWVENMMFEKLLNAIIKHNADLSCCELWLDYRNKGKRKRFSGESRDLISGEESLLGIHRRKYVFPYLCNKLFKAETLKKINYPEAHIIGEDYTITTQVLMNINTVVLIREPLYHYIEHETNMTKGGFDDNRYKALCNYRSLRHSLWNEFPRQASNITNYHLVEELAMLVSMCRNNHYDQSVIRSITSDIRKNLLTFCISGDIPFLFKTCGLCTAISPRLLFNGYKLFVLLKVK